MDVTAWEQTQLWGERGTEAREQMRVMLRLPLWWSDR
jgi:hypothetical protein